MEQRIADAVAHGVGAGARDECRLAFHPDRGTGGAGERQCEVADAAEQIEHRAGGTEIEQLESARHQRLVDRAIEDGVKAVSPHAVSRARSPGGGGASTRSTNAVALSATATSICGSCSRMLSSVSIAASGAISSPAGGASTSQCASCAT